jgi:hypothetical protein
MWKFVLLEGTGDHITYRQQFHSSPKKKGPKAFLSCVFVQTIVIFILFLCMCTLCKQMLQQFCCMWDALLTEKVSNIIQEKD